MSDNNQEETQALEELTISLDATESVSQDLEAFAKYASPTDSKSLVVSQESFGLESILRAFVDQQKEAAQQEAQSEDSD
uniref:Putative anion ABC transporter permease protein n=1 Tax=Talaromyces marneffei PM1 TaxID=1077442 RepID=A0A093VKT4_TALMA